MLVATEKGIYQYDATSNSFKASAYYKKIFGDQNQILKRYVEVILSRVECKVHIGDDAGAMVDLKLVRDRVWGGSPNIFCVPYPPVRL